MTLEELFDFCTRNKVSIRIDPEEGFETVKVTLINDSVQDDVLEISAIIKYNKEFWISESAYNAAITQCFKNLLFELYNRSSGRLSEVEFYRMMFDNGRLDIIRYKAGKEQECV